MYISSLMARDDQLQPKILPDDIIFEILLKLPIKFLCRFKSASKDWLTLINNVLKVRHLNQPQKLIVASMCNKYPYESFYTIDPQSPNNSGEIKSFSNHNLKIVGSCHGLVLLAHYSHDDILYLWNPLTGKHKRIEGPRDPSDAGVIIQGLSYDSARDKFKLVMVIRHRYSAPTYYVFSSSNSVSSRISFTSRKKRKTSSTSWKRVGVFMYEKYSDERAVVLDGSPHWIVTIERRAGGVVYFDPHNEIFQKLPVPVMDSSYDHFYKLTVLGKKLCWVLHSGGDYDFHIWVMKESSWSKLISVTGREHQYFLHVLTLPSCATSGNGEEEDEDDLLNGHSEALLDDLDSGALAFYNLKEKRCKRRLQLPRVCSTLDAVYYVETLASPLNLQIK